MHKFVLLYAILLTTSMTASAAVDCASIQAQCQKDGLAGDVCDRGRAICDSEISRYGSPITSIQDNRLSGSSKSSTLYNSANLCCSGSEGCVGTLSDSTSTASVAALASAKAAAAGATAGIEDSCAKSQAAGQAQVDVNASAAGACYVRRAVCIAKMQEWSQSATGDLLNRLNGAREACARLTSNAALAALTSAQTSATGSAQCVAQSNTTDGTGTKPTDAAAAGTKIDPQTLLGLTQALAAAYQQSTDTSGQTAPATDCSSNSWIAGCQQAASPWTAAGTAGLSAPTQDMSTGAFNVDPASLTPTPPSGVPANPAAAKAASATGVPNGGGGIPGGTGGGASLGGAVPGGSNAQALGSSGKADILHEGGGGASQINAAMNMAPSGSGGFTGSVGIDNFRNVDLAQLLPRDPATLRKLAGGDIRVKSEINTSSVNIWARISEHIQARCNQGLLRDCVPNH